MITYDAFWKFTKENGISQYKLSEDYGLDHRLLDKLRHNKPIKTTTIDKLCQIFKITPNEILTYVEMDPSESSR